MTEPLSPAAQAVFSAWAKPVDVDRSLVVSGQALEAQARGALAAALRAAADQVVPEEPRPTGMRPCGDTYSAREIRRAERMKLREQLLAIAAELEAQ